MTPSPSPSPATIAAVEHEQAVKYAAHRAEALRQQRTGLGLSLDPFRWMSGADVIAEAIRREDARQHPDAVLRRALMSAFNAAVEAGEMDRAEIYDRAYSAASRGSEGWQVTARGLVGLGQARAA